MPVLVRNFFKNSAASPPAEVVTVLHESATVRLEQIASHGQRSPDGFWYDQPEAEWVVLLKGSATLLFAGEKAAELIAGDYLLIPARRRHRVERVSADALWLAVHFRSGEV
jgi:cupin 2 domain-containing protein